MWPKTIKRGMKNNCLDYEFTMYRFLVDCNFRNN